MNAERERETETERGRESKIFISHHTYINFSFRQQNPFNSFENILMLSFPYLYSPPPVLTGLIKTTVWKLGYLARAPLDNVRASCSILAPEQGSLNTPRHLITSPPVLTGFIKPTVWKLGYLVRAPLDNVRTSCLNLVSKQGFLVSSRH